ncbi:MAG TPA: cupin domain-containing protein [Blastocatellia bacterium]|nr:cupin domain-containing protein [Blastocatellia bacterium]
MKKEQCQARVILLLAVGLLCANIARAQEPTNPAAAVLKSPVMLTPEEIKWGECPPALPPGAQCAVIEGDMKAANALFAFRVRMPDNYRIAPHFHPADEHVVVISGVFNMGLGDKLDTSASHPMTAGSFMVMPKGTRHFAWTKGETIIQVYAIGPWGLTYVNPKDDPRNR